MTRMHLNRRFKKSLNNFNLAAALYYGTHINETHGEYRISIEVPGYNQDDVNINLDNGILKIEFEKNGEIKKVISLKLSKDADENKITFTVINGTLTLKIGKIGE